MPTVNIVQHLLHLGFGAGHSQLISQVFLKDTLLLKYFTKPLLMGVVNGPICANCPHWHERIDWELCCYQPIWPGLVMDSKLWMSWLQSRRAKVLFIKGEAW